ncbi:hypothetical protein E1B28_002346 [Marasmius oreades]|uniref:DUF6697 domain-containing protein n=1 Tax=Marasmius oreades TaxID=181124 RepID=A0A9P7UNV2_9AGAR|nr:uncharacterized protein E1B28_002346 [Marasmius oreades]KAG7086389.1 hypothetical protein E1B28_002346 [Marasmius oreades]
MSVKPHSIQLNDSYGLSLPSHEPDGSSPLPEIHKVQDLFRMVDMAIEIEKERAKVLEAMNARDATVGRLGEACNSLRQKTALLERLQKENKLTGAAITESVNQDEKDPTVNSEVVKLEQEIEKLESTIKDLRNEIKKERVNVGDNFNSKSHLTAHTKPYICSQQLSPPVLSRASSQTSLTSNGSHGSGTTIFIVDDNDLDFTIVRSTPPVEAEDVIQIRNKLLSTLPLPEDAPDGSLKPIMLPSHLALHEFLSNAPADLRRQLPHYHVLDDLTTYWCPQREEHGYFLTPAYKCTTHFRVSTAHQWSPADLFGTLTKPTDCFYNKNGTWYYAGVYRAFRLDDLTTKEWDALSQEINLFLCKKTLSGRKNMAPQNVYEVSQLYGVGALKIACIGLQCVGFNREMYRSILALVEKSGQTGKLGHGRGREDSRDIADVMASLQIASRAENEA